MKSYEILIGLLIWFLLPNDLIGQQNIDYPRDTTYSVWSASRKLKKTFPDVVAVNEFENLQIQSVRDVLYNSSGNRELHMDIFWPSVNKEKKIPVVICIHGGGWASGNKSHLVPMAQNLAENGFFTATIEYRLSPEAKYPAAVYDIKTAIIWVKANAVRYNIDTAKIAVLGASAGATIASLVGTTSGNPLFINQIQAKLVSDQVQAIVNIDGVLDFTDPAESGKDSNPNKPSAATRWFGSTFKENPDIWIEASPLTWVNEKTPPTLFINSAVPRFHAGRDQYLYILEKYGTYYEVHTIPETPHTFWLFHPWFNETIFIINRFLNLIFN